MLNLVQIIGRVGADPEIRYSNKGTPVANLRVATTEKWRDKQTGENREETEWHRVAIFGKLAEIVESYVSKGDLLYLSGPIRTRKWQDKNGEDRYSTEITAKEMKMLTPRADKPRSAPARRDEPEVNDDIPF